MIKMNFFVFLGVLEVCFIIVLACIIQAILIKKYRPYYMANTRPELFLRKYIQYLIKETRKFGSQFDKSAVEGDKSAYRTRQNMTARLNWLVLERDFMVTTVPDIRYWEDINKRIKSMLSKWKEVEIIKEPPEIEIIKLAFDSNDSGIDSINAQKPDKETKKLIASLQKQVKTIDNYEAMNKEMDLAYQTLEATYNQLKDSLKDLELEADEADKLRNMLKQQEANEASLNAMMDELEASKDRLNAELEQLGDAYEALENEGTQTQTQPNILSNSDNPDAQEIIAILNEQQSLLSSLKQTVSGLKIKPDEKETLNNHTGKIEQSNKEINHSMQMLELERERLAEEVKQLLDESEES